MAPESPLRKAGNDLASGGNKGLAERSSRAERQVLDTALADVIDGIFASFDLHFPSQFRTAFAEPQRLQGAKRIWYDHLHQVPKRLLQRAIKKTLVETRFIPSVNEVLENCFKLSGMPELYQAWIEALDGAPYWQHYRWSHPAIVATGENIGWAILATGDDGNSELFRLFKRSYFNSCLELLTGETRQETVTPEQSSESVQQTP